MNTESHWGVPPAYESHATETPRPCPRSPVSDATEITHDLERDLVRRAQAGDEDAFGTLMRSHYEPVFRLVNAMLRDDHSARDVCQEIWLTVWKNLRTFRGDAKFSTWVHPIATRRAIDHLRSRKRWFSRFIPFRSDADSTSDTEGGGDRVDAAPEAVEATDPRQDLERHERNARFERAIGSLPPKHRAVLALREIQGLSYDEIAENLGVARGTVMSRLFHARRLLVQKLGDQP
jgi:RNA polymerase sigma-70 factor (ECF subfamily)